MPYARKVPKQSIKYLNAQEVVMSSPSDFQEGASFLPAVELYALLVSAGWWWSTAIQFWVSPLGENVYYEPRNDAYFRSLVFPPGQNLHKIHE